MTATNHALTGAVIGLTVSQPAIAIPLAFLSHFVCDSIPHFGMGKKFIKTSAFRNMLIADGLLCIILVLLLFTSQSSQWMLASICALIATSPDLVWANRYRLEMSKKRWQPSAFSRFAGKIQWFERPSGAIVELAWFIGGVVLVSQIVLA